MNEKPRSSLHPKTGHVVFLKMETASVMAPIIESERLAGRAERRFEAAAFLIPERVSSVQDGTPWLAEWIRAPEHALAFQAAAKAERLSLNWASFRPELAKWDFVHFTQRHDWMPTLSANWSFEVSGSVEGRPLKHAWQAEGLRRALDAMTQSLMASAPMGLGGAWVKNEDFPRPFMTPGQMRERAAQVEAREPSLVHLPRGGKEYRSAQSHSKTQLEWLIDQQAGMAALSRANEAFCASQIALRLDAEDLQAALREAGGSESALENHTERAPAKRI